MSSYTCRVVLLVFSNLLTARTALATIALALSVATEIAAQAAPPALTLTREMRIDGAAADFVNVGWIVPMRNGLIAVSQLQDRNVLFFDSTGKSVAKFGRDGQGPGEFQRIGEAGLVGDSLWISDITSRRITVMAPNFTYAREIINKGAHPAPGSENLFPSASDVTWFAVYGDGTTLVRPTLQQVQVTPPAYERTGTTLMRIASDGTIRQKVVRIDDWKGIVSTGRGTNGYASATIPFYARPIMAVSDRGIRIASLSCNYDGPNARTMNLVVVTPTGDTVLSRNYPFTVVPVPNARRDSIKNAMVESTSRRGGAQAGGLAAALREMSVPNFYPPFAAMLLSDDGTVWIGLRAGALTGVSSYMVVDRAGNVVGNATLPASTRPLAINATHVWGIELDQNDVPSIVRYRVSR